MASAKIVITRGPDGIDAINSQDFALPPYRTLIDTREKFAKEHGLIGGGLGIFAHGDYLATHRSSLLANASKTHLLGQRIKKALQGHSFERPLPPPKPSVHDLLAEFYKNNS